MMTPALKRGPSLSRSRRNPRVSGALAIATDFASVPTMSPDSDTPLIGEEPQDCLAHGASYVREGVQGVVFCYLRFPSGIVAHLHLSWLDPHKERRLTVVGSRRMATFDDMLIEGKLTIYDKGFDEDTRSWGEYITRSGDVFSPRIPNAEPLRLECEHFVQCIRTGATPRSDGHSGLRVVRVLEQLQRSLEG